MISQATITGRRSMFSPFNRYRLVKIAIPIFLVAYLLMVPLRLVVPHSEVYPFFAWTLFSRTPGWFVTENALLVHSVDGYPVDGAQYLIPGNKNLKDQKVLIGAIAACRNPEDCDAAVERLLYPVVRRLTGGDDVVFSIVRARIDLRDVRSDIANLAAGASQKSDYFEPYALIGKWSTSDGRIRDSSTESRGAPAFPVMTPVAAAPAGWHMEKSSIREGDINYARLLGRNE